MCYAMSIKQKMKIKASGNWGWGWQSQGYWSMPHQPGEGRSCVGMQHSAFLKNVGMIAGAGGQLLSASVNERAMGCLALRAAWPLLRSARHLTLQYVVAHMLPSLLVLPFLRAAVELHNNGCFICRRIVR